MNKIKIMVIVVLAMMIFSSLILVNNSNVNNTVKNIPIKHNHNIFTVDAGTGSSNYWNTTSSTQTNSYQKEILNPNIQNFSFLNSGTSPNSDIFFNIKTTTSLHFNISMQNLSGDTIQPLLNIVLFNASHNLRYYLNLTYATNLVNEQNSFNAWFVGVAFNSIEALSYTMYLNGSTTSSNANNFYLSSTDAFASPYNIFSAIPLGHTLSIVPTDIGISKIYWQVPFGNYVLPQFAPYPNFHYFDGNSTIYWNNNTIDNIIFSTNSININGVQPPDINSISSNNFISNLSSYDVNVSYNQIYGSGYLNLRIANFGLNNNIDGTFYANVLYNTYNNSYILKSNYSANNIVSSYSLLYNISINNENSIVSIQPYTLTYVKYPVFFNESQFPIGSQWQLAIGGHTYTSTTNSIELNLTTGDYPYSASFGAYTANGNEVISGTNYTKNILLSFRLQTTYYLTIDTNNYNNFYNVVISGSSYSIIDNNNLIPIINGTYSINAKVNGYSIVYPSQITITGNKTIYFNFTMTNRYLTFVESGLYIGVSWTVNVNNTNYNSIGNKISIWLSQTNYNYVVSIVKNYTVSPASGTVDLTSNNTIDIIFTHYPYLTIDVVGYQQNYPYTFSINSNIYFLTNSNNKIPLPSGTYNYVFNFNKNFTWTNGNIVINSNTTLTENVSVKMYYITFISNINNYTLILNNTSYNVYNTFIYQTTNHLLKYSAIYSNFYVKYSQNTLSYNINQTIYINFTKIYEFILVSEIDTTWSIVFNNQTYINNGNIVLLSYNNNITFSVNAISGYIPDSYIHTIHSSSFVSITQINFTTANNIQSEQFNMLSLLPYLVIFMFIAFVGVIGFIRKRGKDE